MATEATWPDVLPAPTFTDYALEPQDPIVRTSMEQGAARQRLRFTNVPTDEPVRWRFSAWQFAIFEAWIKHYAAFGAAWFEIDLLGGLGLTTHEARFKGTGGKPYRAVPKRGRGGVTWIVNSVLEVRSRPVLTQDALDIVLAEDATGLMAAIGSFETLVNTTIPANPW